MRDNSQPAIQPVVVVPDGLAADPVSGNAVPRPSFVYRAVLDHVVRHYANHPLYLAPANDFGCGVTEQESAALYIGANVNSVTVVSPQGGYIDTRGNAKILRQHLEKLGVWPLSPIILVAAKFHAKRAALCFKKEGFVCAVVDAVDYTNVGFEPIVRRLWYYKYPLAHGLYEYLATLRDLCRPAAKV